MPTCKDCKFFKPKEDKAGFGDCFGHEILADMDTEKCPTKSFQPKEKEEK